ncbi:MAG: copper homeostasis protein CutC [Cyclobacteriaceae bacterium]
MLKEACVETLEQAVNAERLGADRLELCSRLDLDGLTPEIPLYKRVREVVSIPIHVMIRIKPIQAPDDFILSEEDLVQMEKQIRDFQQLKAEGFVIGALSLLKQVSIDQVKRLSNLLQGEKFIFHKAIDRTIDPIASAIQLERETAITHILTSGGAETAQQGKEVMKQMQEQLDRVIVIAAGGITDQNLPALDEYLNISEYHGKKIVGNLHQD